MGEDTDFDVIIIGCGMAGMACAAQLLKEGVEGDRILVVDRGEPIGGKNMSGGVLWGRELDDLADIFPNWEMDNPGIERYINHKKIGFLSEDDAFIIEGKFASWDGIGGTKEPSMRTGWSVLRGRTDAWFAEKLEEAGVFIMPGIKIDQLHIEDLDHTSYDPRDLTTPSEDSGKGNAQKWRIDNQPEIAGKVRNGRICGIVQDGEVMTSQVVVIAEGSNSVLTRSYGFDSMIHAQDRHGMLLGVKEVIHLGEDVINSRFGCFAGDEERPPSGLAMEGALAIYDNMAEKAWEDYPETAGLVPRAGGWLYTNRDTLSIGVVIQLDSLPQGIHTYDMLAAYKAHSAIAPLLEGGEVVEYGGHLVPEYGLDRMPTKLVRDGAVVIGDAAGLVYSNGAVIQGQNYSIHSGKLAGKVIAKCVASGNCNSSTLGQYKKDLDASYVMRDLKRFKTTAKFLSDDANYTWVPKFMGTMFNRVVREIGEEKITVEKQAFRLRKEMRRADKKTRKGMGLLNLLRLGRMGRKL
ncbi:MAG: Electron transfer flavoprotein-ubiquinone oxidoreductase [Methanobacteriota archaeon]|nr:MAG: Electron transfer flavoprotein-ubiquinone oxidoreductase [Euryarchaeota archaeon]